MSERMDCITQDGSPVPCKWVAVDNPIKNCDAFGKKEPEVDPPTKPNPMNCDPQLPPGNCSTPLRGEYKELFPLCNSVSSVYTSSLGKTQDCIISRNRWLKSRPCRHLLADHCTGCGNACSCYIRPHTGEDPYFLGRFVPDQC